jgi:hypothetical protein
LIELRVEFVPWCNFRRKLSWKCRFLMVSDGFWWWWCDLRVATNHSEHNGVVDVDTVAIETWSHLGRPESPSVDPVKGKLIWENTHQFLRNLYSLCMPM